MASVFLVGLSLLLGLALILKLYGTKQWRIRGLPKGSMGWPLVGETLSYLKPHRSNSMGIFLQEHCTKYGKIFRSHLFFRPTIVSCDLELSSFVLQNEGKLFQSSYPKPIHDILGNLSMMLVHGDLHKKLRSVALSFINDSKSNPSFLDSVDKLAASFIDSCKAKGNMVFCKEAKKFTFYLMLKNLTSIDPGDPLAEEILKDFLTFNKGFVSLPLYVPGTAHAKAIKARKRIASTLKDILKRRDLNTANGRSSSSSSSAAGFLDELMSNEGLNDEERVSVLLDLLLAGYETTSGLMSLLVYFLARASSSILEALQEEHGSLRKSKKDGEALNWEDYKKMRFTSHVINEALRCGNLVKFLHRKALTDVKYKEYVIPAGWQVLPILSASHLDPTLHQNPDEFDPWRWDVPSTSRKSIPFGGGLRICPGAELGKLEAAFFLHYFVLNVRWEIKDDDDDCPILYPYLEFKNGLKLQIEPIENIN